MSKGTEPGPIQHLRALVQNAAVTDESESTRAAQLATVSEFAHDLRDFAKLLDPGGSRAVDIGLGGYPGAATLPANMPERQAYDRLVARDMLDQLRASQLTADTPGIDPRRVETDGSTGIGNGLDLVRAVATQRPFSVGGTSPVVPGVTAGDTDGVIRTEGGIPSTLKFTLGDVGAAENREVAASLADFSSQVRDWTDPQALAMLDAIMVDIADRAAELHLGGRLVAEAGGTRAVTALGDDLDAAEAAAAASVTGGPVWLIANPADWPTVRRAVAPSWQPGLPRPQTASSIGVPAGTVVLLATDGVHLAVDAPIFEAVDTPATFGREVSANRPLYLAIRQATAIQTVTGV